MPALEGGAALPVTTGGTGQTEARAAVPVYVVPGGPVIGQRARRVVVVTSGPVEGGAARPVYDAGAGALYSNEAALPVFVVPGGGSLGGGGSAPSSLLTGLAAYWNMNEVSGNRADSVGALTLVDNNTVTSNTGKISNAAEFTTANSESLSVASAAALQGGLRDFCFDGWVYIAVPATTQYLLAKGTGTTPTLSEYGLYCAGSALLWRISNGSAAFDTTGQAISANTFYYVCMWFDATLLVAGLQINNNAPVTIAVTGTPNTTAGALRFGSSGTPGNFMGGRWDEIGRWNRLLTGTERASRYNAGNALGYPFSGAQVWGPNDWPIYTGSFTYSSSIES